MFDPKHKALGQQTSVVVAGVELETASSLSVERLAFLRAPNPLQNITIRLAIELATAIAKVPKFSGLMLFAMPGTYSAGPLVEDAVELSVLLKEGAGADDSLYVHVMFPNREILNMGLLRKMFATSWYRGVGTILLEAYHDGRAALMVVSEVPSVAGAIAKSTDELFGQFRVIEGDPFDPFTQPTGLQPVGIQPLRLGLGEVATDPTDL